ncbi:MAG: 50S ribosomal protein L6 [Candidatus Marinimicrobia bacterium]|jgi:large subunit ribosomal protein L6|nr:50S ribosomal protein L6 [Candidatus Neomarinimicrobiota bacterium]MDP6611896.1 50S ribosomal protein L6 [Candidatus Neomarinimicrobiota bacterium]|tara:strand:- start:82642 stop:83184 length:543 start_codon:yes stop_codon:yes gene_type:complete
MSRIGKQIIEVPQGVTVSVNSGAVALKGPKGTMAIPYHGDMEVKHDNDKISVNRPSDSRIHRSLHGTTRQLIANGVRGVSEGFSRELEIRGVGFQANMQKKYLVLQLGFSHDIYFEPPEGIEIKANRTEVTVSGINKQLVGEVAAKIRSFRKPEPYKGKGVRYKNEYVRSKQGKTVGEGG